MIEQICEKSIGHRVRFHLFNSSIRWLYFKVNNSELNTIQKLAEFLEITQKGKFPKGIYSVDVVIDNIFQIQYNNSEITEEKVISFAKALGL